MTPLSNGERSLWHGIPVTHLRSADGAAAVIADHGAHLLAWYPGGDTEALFLSTASGYGSNAAIRGGIPVIFPQFGERGRGKRHGFARTSLWRLLSVENDQDDGAATARLSLTGKIAAATVETVSLDDLDYSLFLEVRLLGPEIRISLKIENRSSARFECHAALHSYLAVDDILTTSIEGLQGTGYLDQANGGISVKGHADALRINGEIDRIYGNVTAPVGLYTCSRKIQIKQEGFSDVVVWNPGSEKGEQLEDLEQDGYRRFICIEAASVLTPLTLEPGGTWTGIQHLTTANFPLVDAII